MNHDDHDPFPWPLALLTAAAAAAALGYERLREKLNRKDDKK